MYVKIRVLMAFFLIMIFISISFLTCPGIVKCVYGYYGFPNTFAFSCFGSPFMAYGLLGASSYNGMFNPLVFGGISNLTSSLNRFNTLGLLNHSYGLGNFYGLNGFMGLYGLSNLYGSNGSALPGFGLTSLISPGNLITATLNNPFFLAEQAGTWTGTWNLGFLTGTMIMNLNETITGSLSGTAQLIGNLTFGGIFNVYGTADTTFVYLSGQDPTLTYAVSLQCTLPTPTTMEGFYSIYKIGATVPKETGTFSLQLLI